MENISWILNGQGNDVKTSEDLQIHNVGSSWTLWIVCVHRADATHPAYLWNFAHFDCEENR